jgi:hypothetical protein
MKKVTISGFLVRKSINSAEIRIFLTIEAKDLPSLLKIIHALELGKVSKKSKPVDWFFLN